MIPGSMAAMMFGGSEINAKTTAYLAAMSVQPPADVKAMINDFINSIESAGIFNKFDSLYLFNLHDEQASRINLVNPGVETLTAVNTPLFTAYEGWAWQTSGSRYLIAPSNLNTYTRYQQNDAHYGCYTNTNVAGTQVDCGTPSNSNVVLNPRDASNNWVFRINMTGLYSVANPNGASSIGHHVAVRTSSTAIQGFINGTGLTVGSSPSSAVPATPFGALTAPAAQSARQLSLLHCGASLSSGEISSLYSAFNAFKSAIDAAY